MIPNLQRRFENTESEFVKARLHQYMSEQPCAACGGTRLKQEAMAVRIHAERRNWPRDTAPGLPALPGAQHP